VCAELVDAVTGHVFWANTWQGRSDELFNAQGALVPALIAKSMPSLQSYTLLLSAIALTHRHPPSDFERAREMLEHLAERDRRSALPHPWLASKWHVLRVQQGWSHEVEREAQLAPSQSAHAVDNDPDNGPAWTISGFALTNLMGRIDEDDRSYLQALGANPNESLAWLLKGMKRAFVGDGAPAVEDMAHAVALSPLDPLRYFYDSLSAAGAPAG
jgi:tetratricopeptide (TPR) repeat protein